MFCQQHQPSRRQAFNPATFRPATLALAIAAAFCGPAQLAFGNPAGAQVIAGQATLATNGNNLVVTTQNAAGSNFSAINWQSFNIPAGSTTRFVQPSATSTSINRVQSNNPSAIFGSLSSNGNLVLVNPSGITVGAGAVVDTAGFVASALPMSNSDALAGRQRFGANSAQPGGNLQIQGSVIARNGDVVLIAPSVEVAQTGVVQAPNGSAILAAGQSIEVTGRGLEGIRLAVQAPADRAVNLGTLQGDAVALFASSLKHSGLIQATAVSNEGGRVILRGQELVEVEGKSSASRLNRLGGLFEATADKVGLSGTASVDVSGASGGGQILIGGDYQGKNPDVRNAQMTFVGAGAQLNASATEQGDGGKVIVWSDRSTRVFGDIQARGGATGGNGGLVETSGKVGLEYGAKVDVSATNGLGGTLLLDPDSISIVGGNRPPGTAVSPTTIDFLDSGPSQVYQSDIQGMKDGTNLILAANAFIGVAGTFTEPAVTLSLNSNLNLHTRNSASDVSSMSGIRLSDGNLGASLEFRTQGTGTISMETGTAGPGGQKADISIGKVSTVGGSISLLSHGNGSDVILLGNIAAGTGPISIKSDGIVRFDSNLPMTLTGSSLSIYGGKGTVVNAALSDLTHAGGTWTNPTGSSLTINGALHVGPNTALVNEGVLNISSNAVFSTGNQDLTNGASGSLRGNGTIDVGTGTLTNQGTVAPGHSPGTMTIRGNYAQSDTGSLNIEVASATNFDVLQVSGKATIGGSLSILPFGYTPNGIESYTFLRAGSISGTFSSLSSNTFASGTPTYSTSVVGFTANSTTGTTGTGITTGSATTGTTGTGTTTGSATTGTTGTGTTTGSATTGTTGTGTTTGSATTGTTGTGTTTGSATTGSTGNILITNMTSFRNLIDQFPLSTRPGNQITLVNLSSQPPGSEFIIDDGQVCR